MLFAVAGATTKISALSMMDIWFTPPLQFSDDEVSTSFALRASKVRAETNFSADSDRTIQILTNLLANALHYTPSGGEVWIHAERGKDEARVLVRDTGRGIPPEHLPRLITRFYRVDSSRSRAAGGGSGIGLTVAKHLVEAQGGRIWAESEGKGKGSAFYFTLPLA